MITIQDKLMDIELKKDVLKNIYSNALRTISEHYTFDSVFIVTPWLTEEFENIIKKLEKEEEDLGSMETEEEEYKEKLYQSALTHKFKVPKNEKDEKIEFLQHVSYVTKEESKNNEIFSYAIVGINVHNKGKDIITRNLLNNILEKNCGSEEESEDNSIKK